MSVWTSSNRAYAPCPLVDVIEQLEPQLIGYGFCFDDTANQMIVTAAHPESASLELHMAVVERSSAS